jgi:hypothetical protein
MLSPDLSHRPAYVVKQGWATMPGEHEGDSRVAEECVTRLLKTS